MSTIEKPSEVGYFGFVPTDPLKQIFSYLDNQAISALSRVNTTFKDTILLGLKPINMPNVFDLEVFDNFRKGRLVFGLGRKIYEEITDHFFNSFDRGEYRFSKINFTLLSLQRDPKKWSLLEGLGRWKCGFQGVVLEGLGGIHYCLQLGDLPLNRRVRTLKRIFKAIDLSSIVNSATKEGKKFLQNLSIPELLELVKFQGNKNLRHAIRDYKGIDELENNSFTDPYVRRIPPMPQEIDAFYKDKSLQNALKAAKPGLLRIEENLRNQISFEKNWRIVNEELKLENPVNNSPPQISRLRQAAFAVAALTIVALVTQLY